jgi:hypothetical protein
MVAFNPQEPATQDPNYLSYSRVVDAPSPNVSKKMALETAGEGFTGAVSLLDTSLKKGLQDDINKKVDVMRDSFTEGLEKVKSQLDAGLIPNAVTATKGSSVGSSILDGDATEAPELPVGLDSGLSRVQQLAYAKAQGSVKINDTQYAKDTFSLAKQLRAQYPGYREYIDQQVSQASGLPVANSYYSNLMLDINRQLNQIGKTKDDVGKMMLANMDVPNMATYIDKRNSGDKTVTDSFIYHKIGDWQNLQTQLKVDAARRAENKDSRETQVQTETGNLTRNLNQLVDHHLNDTMALSGMPTLKELTSYFDDVSAGRRPAAGDTEVQQRAAQLSVYRNYIYSQAKSMSKGPDAVIGNDAAETTIKNALTPIDSYITFANNKETGPAFFNMRQNLAVGEDEKHNNWLFNKDRGAISRQMMGGRAIMGEQYFPDWIKGILVNGQDKPISDLFSQEAMSAVVPLTDVRGKPIERTLKDMIQHGKKVGVNDPEYYGSGIGLVSKIADPNMPLPAKDNLIKWAFQPKNVGILSELKTDYVDPATGNTVPGKYHAFNIMTAPAVTMSIAKASEGHPENYKMYKDTMEGEYGTLFRSDLTQLNKLMQKPYLNVHFSFNSDNNQFGLVDSRNKPITRNDRALGIENPNAVYVNSMLDTLDRVNGGVKNLATIHKYNPEGEGDTGQYLLKTMQSAGFRPGSLVTGGTEGMMKAVIKSRNPDMTPQQLDKMLLQTTPPVPVQPLNYSREDRGPSVSEFVRNPTGKARPPSVNLSDSTILDWRTDDIPEDMSAREFLAKLKKEGK